MVSVALTGGGIKAVVSGLPRTRKDRHSAAVDTAGQPPAHHLVEVAEEAEPGHIRGRVNIIASTYLGGRLVQGRHGGHGGVHGAGGSFAHAVGRADEAHPQRLGEDELVAGLSRIIGSEAAGVHETGDRQAVLHASVGDGVASREDAPRLGHFFCAAAQDLTEDVQIHALREADEIQCSLHLAAHSVNVAESVCRRDLAEGVGVIHHRREEVHRLHQRDVVGDAVDSRIVPAVVANEKVGVFLTPGQLFQNMAQHSRAELGGTAAARAEDDFVLFCHQALSSSSKCVKYPVTSYFSFKMASVCSPAARRAASSAWLRTA